MMISRTSLARATQQVVRCSGSAQRRGFAAAASTGSFETKDVNGLRTAFRDSHGPTTTLSLVAKAGTRYEPLPRLAEGLEQFAFKSTERRSALRIQRETELLGGQLSSFHTREVLIVQARFLRADLPYFTELLEEVISSTKYTTHEFHEEIERILPFKQAAANADVPAQALDNAHSVAFHTGLGASLTTTSSIPFRKYVNEEFIARFANVVYSKPNIAVVAEGADGESVSKWVGQFFNGVPAAAQSGQTLKSEASKYFGGEQRTSHTGGNSIVIAFPGSNILGSDPEIEVLAALLGGQPTIKWTPGFSLLSKTAFGTPGLSVSSTNRAYSDAGLLTIQQSGPAASVRKAAEEAVKALKSVSDGSISKEDVSKAVAKAKFDLLEKAQNRTSGIILAGTNLLHADKAADTAALAKSLDGVTADKLRMAAKTLLDGKATVSAVGDLFVLPYGSELGLRV